MVSIDPQMATINITDGHLDRDCGLSHGRLESETTDSGRPGAHYHEGRQVDLCLSQDVGK